MIPPLPEFGAIRFGGTLRPSQDAARSIILPQLERGEKRLHVVAPPGSGKTILGLYVWADMVRKPALVLSPNSAIQAQWAARTSLFDLDGKEEFISTDPKNPGLLTSLTYQSITMPKKGGEDLDLVALELWAEKLMEDGQADDRESAIAWQQSLLTSNDKYYRSRLSTYRKKVRDDFAKNGNALWTLHESAKANLMRLKEVGIGLIILDECHHLMHHWGRILSEVKEFFGDPVVLGLTATPPDTESISNDDSQRYEAFFGPVDYEVPVPALVRHENLAPYQDLCYFVRPAAHELQYIANVDKQFEDLLSDLRDSPTKKDSKRIAPLDEWVFTSLKERKNHRGETLTWSKFQNKNQVYADNARRYLHLHQSTLPSDVPPVPMEASDESWTRMSMLRSVLDRYVRYGLRLSKNKEDHERAKSVISRLRMLGVQITETGSRPCASPVGRVMAYASSKVDALNEIITVEMQALGPSIRAVVVTDFEKTSATALVDGVLDKEAGGAIAVFRSLVKHQAGDYLDPILMTGSTVLVDDDLAERFIERASEWMKERDLEVTFLDKAHDGYHEIHGRGKHWVPRYYSLMITELFQEGFTRCIVGTRGLLGEGWDASRINVLVDMTTVTTSMSINQLRGRSIRLDKEWKEKVANNWDIVCIADEFTKGFDDYERFKQKHKQLYGVCDDGTIEKGVGHVHAAFNDVRPEGISEGMSLFNEEMVRRAMTRDHTRELWGIGQPFGTEAKPAVEAKARSGFSSGFQFGEEKQVWTDASLTQAIANAIVDSLCELGDMTRHATPKGGERGGGWVRYHLHNSTPDEAKIFSEALTEALGPLEKPRYIIERSSRFFDETWLSKLMPEVIAAFLRKQRVSVMMYHAVPSCLATSKERAQVYQRHWNHHVSPGVVTYVRSGDGRELVHKAQLDGLVPRVGLHQKSVYE
jgi:superfamily II DNA or RNA helicase|tara:strand:+ start:262 stop:3048 length:2787 start_codon:yes stop_codon:yes gene_type:complete